MLSAGHHIRGRGRRVAAALALAAVCVCAAAPCRAVEEDGDLAAMRDPDYAAGRKAVEAKDWSAAIKF